MVSLRIFDADMHEVEGELVAPIQITMVANWSAESGCVFWDSVSEAWSTRGVRYVGAGDQIGTVVCETTHLSLFAVIVAEFKLIFACSNAAVLTRRSFDNALNNLSVPRPAALLYVGALLGCCLTTLIAAWHDWRNKKKLAWSEDIFLTRCEECKSLSAKFTEDIKFLLTSILKCKLTTLILDKCVLVLAANSSGVHMHDVPLFLRLSQAQAMDMHTKSMQPSATVSTRWFHEKVTVFGAEIQDHAENSITTFVSSSNILRRWWVIFKITHPWMSLFQLSVKTTAAIRAMLLSSHLLGGLFVNALLFEQVAKNTALLEDIDPRCVVDGPGATILRNICLGICSSLIGVVPLLIIGLLQRRDFMYDEKWDEQRRWKQIRTWALFDLLTWLLGVLYIAVASVFVLLFAANVNELTAMCWCVSAATLLVKQLLVTPMVSSGFCATWISSHLLRRGSLDEMSSKCFQDLMRIGGANEEEFWDIHQRRIEAIVNIQRFFRKRKARRLQRVFTGRTSRPRTSECRASDPEAEQQAHVQLPQEFYEPEMPRRCDAYVASICSVTWLPELCSGSKASAAVCERL